MGSPPPERLVEVYAKRMKIEQTFKDAKSLLNIEKVMSKGRVQLEATLALVLLAYGLASMIGEAARDEAYGGGDEKGGVPGSRRRKWKLYSGVFVLLKKRLSFHGGSMAKHLGRRAGAMEEASVSAAPVR